MKKLTFIALLFTLWLSSNINATNIFDACKYDNKRLLRKAYKKDISSVNIKDQFGLSPLYWAIIKSHTYIVKELIEYEADVNATDNNGDTPLHRAAEYGNTKLVNILLTNGADPLIKNEFSEIPLYWAIRSKHKKIVIQLLTFPLFLQCKKAKISKKQIKTTRIKITSNNKKKVFKNINKRSIIHSESLFEVLINKGNQTPSLLIDMISLKLFETPLTNIMELKYLKAFFDLCCQKIINNPDNENNTAKYFIYKLYENNLPKQELPIAIKFAEKCNSKKIANLLTSAQQAKTYVELSEILNIQTLKKQIQNC